VQFNDTSNGTPTNWLWDFGDGANSTEKNTTHTYSAAGNYTVNLSVSNSDGTDSELAAINVLPVNEGIEWGPTKQYGTGGLNSIAIDDAGHIVEVHVDSEKLFYRVGKVDYDHNITG